MSNTNPGETAVPAGYRLGAGWRLMPTRYEQVGPGGKMQTFVMRGAHIKELVDIGALVPIPAAPVAEPAQPNPTMAEIAAAIREGRFRGRPLSPPPVPPGPVPPEGEPVEGRKNVCVECKRDNQELSVMGRCRACSPAAAPAKASPRAAKGHFACVGCGLRRNFEAGVTCDECNASRRAWANVPLSPEQLDASAAWSRQWLRTAGLSPSEYRRHYATVQLADR